MVIYGSCYPIYSYNDLLSKRACPIHSINRRVINRPAQILISHRADGPHSRSLDFLSSKTGPAHRVDGPFEWAVQNNDNTSATVANLDDELNNVGKLCKGQAQMMRNSRLSAHVRNCTPERRYISKPGIVLIRLHRSTWNHASGDATH